MPSRHILVFGGTSPTGLVYCNTALAAGHKLTLFVRNPSKLSEDISKNVSTVVGTLEDPAKIEEAVACGADVCVSFLGPNLKGQVKGRYPVAEGYKIILPLLSKYKYTRLLAISTPSYRVPEDKFSLLFRFMVWFIYLFVNSAYKEITTFSPLITSVPVDELKWTLFRVPLLQDGEAKTVKAAYVGEGVKATFQRKGMAIWLLEEMDENKWVGKCPMLSDA